MMALHLHSLPQWFHGLFGGGARQLESTMEMKGGEDAFNYSRITPRSKKLKHDDLFSSGSGPAPKHLISSVV